MFLDSTGAVIPGKSGTLWRSTFIDTPTTLDKPYKMAFALHVTPTKPVSLKKENIYHNGAEYDLPTKPGPNAVELPVEGCINPEQGTIECWVKPTFDINSDSGYKEFLNINNQYPASLGD
jgi:hypothetical protein